MKIEQDDQFRAEHEAFSLKFTCENCTLFDERTESCAHGFPTEEHRAARYTDARALVVFCKEFELD